MLDNYLNNSEFVDETESLTKNELSITAKAGIKKHQTAVSNIPRDEAQGLMAFHLLVGALDEENMSNTMYKMEQLPTTNIEAANNSVYHISILLIKGLLFPIFRK